MQRKLAAILATDVVGYSAMMEADQDKTLAEIRSLQSEILGPATGGNNGEIVKSMGDGWLIAFASASDAVNAAMTVQNALAGRKNLRLRIGIHLGDVTFAENDVFGDGVNIAARLEALADAGGVLKRFANQAVSRYPILSTIPSMAPLRPPLTMVASGC